MKTPERRGLGDFVARWAERQLGADHPVRAAALRLARSGGWLDRRRLAKAIEALVPADRERLARLLDRSAALSEVLEEDMERTGQELSAAAARGDLAEVERLTRAFADLTQRLAASRDPWRLAGEGQQAIGAERSAGP